MITVVLAMLLWMEVPKQLCCLLIGMEDDERIEGWKPFGIGLKVCLLYITASDHVDLPLSISNT